MKRYLAFGGDAYYPGGGWEDFKSDCDTLDQAINACRHEEWWHVIDITAMKRVANKKFDKDGMYWNTAGEKPVAVPLP
jgi:3-methyladenine DNA glycosylase AlkD